MPAHDDPSYPISCSIKNANTSGGVRGALLRSACLLVPLRFAAAGLFVSCFSVQAYALDAAATPQGGTVVAGQATITSNPGSVIINQKSTRTVIDWSSFNIGTQGKAEFKQPTSASIAVNRVTGKSSDPTQILGSLTSNGKIFILDGNGVIFGKTAKVDVGGIVASTGKIDTTAFMAGANTLALTGMMVGTVENRGTISIKAGGLAAFVAPHVVNSGVIRASVGKVALASGNRATLDLYGDQLVSIAVDDGVQNALVENSGSIDAAGGSVYLTAEVAKGVVNTIVNMTGTISADTVGESEGRIVLSGGNNGGVAVSGTLQAAGADARETGGTVQIAGAAVALNGATVNVSGAAGGGTALIGGSTGNGTALKGARNADTTTVSANSSITADATSNGNGGTIIIWGNDATAFHGTASAKGGAKGGNGGFVEVSTGSGVIFDGTVNTTAKKGKTGTLLIDPAAVTIGNGPDTFGGGYLNAQNIANTLVFTNVSVTADSTIDIADNINLSQGNSGVTSFNLSLSAPTLNLLHNIILGNGNLSSTATTLNLGGAGTNTAGAVLGTGRVSSAATTVNVLGDSASLQQAINMAASAATINVAGGNYAGNLAINKAVTLNGTADATTVTGTTANGTVATVTAAGVSINNFTFGAGVAGRDDSDVGLLSSASNFSLSNSSFAGFDGSGLSITGGSNINISHNLFSDIGADAIDVANASGVTISGNTITGDGGFGAQGFGIYASNVSGLVLDGNTVAGSNGGTGAGLDAFSVNNSAGAVVTNNLVSGSAGGTGAARDGFVLLGSDNATVTDNTSYSDGAAGSTGSGRTAFNLSGSNNVTAANNQVLPVPTDTGGGDTGGGDTGGGDTGGGDTGGGDTGGGNTGGDHGHHGGHGHHDGHDHDHDGHGHDDHHGGQAGNGHNDNHGNNHNNGHPVVVVCAKIIKLVKLLFSI